jgi:hypothetical protein
MKIPRKLHFVWVGDSSPPPLSQECIASWTKMHEQPKGLDVRPEAVPEFEIVMWTNKDVTREKFPLTWKFLQRAKNMAELKDVMILEILFHEGGFYVDTDIYCLRNLNKFVDPEVSFVVCHEDSSLWQRKYKEETLFNAKKKFLPCTNAFFGACPKHSLLESLLSGLESLKWGPISTNELTGPWYFGKHLCPKLEEVQILLPQSLYEILWNHTPERIFQWAKELENTNKPPPKTKLEQVYAKNEILGMHLWCQSWRSFDPLLFAIGLTSSPSGCGANGEEILTSSSTTVIVIIPFRHQEKNWFRWRNLKLVVNHWKSFFANHPQIQHEIIVSEQKIFVKDETPEPQRGVHSVDQNWEGITWISEATGQEGFNRSRAFNQGVEKSCFLTPLSQAIFVFSDADILLSTESLEKSFLTLQKNPWTSISPYSNIFDLSETRVLQFMDGDDWQSWCTEKEEWSATKRLGINDAGGVFIMSQKVFNLVGGWDESFIGWGKEDAGFLKKLHSAGNFVMNSCRSILKEKITNGIEVEKCKLLSSQLETLSQKQKERDAIPEVPHFSFVLPTLALDFSAVHLFHL